MLKASPPFFVFFIRADSLHRKCTLKDGVLTVNGKEYVFNKATGEYEW